MIKAALFLQGLALRLAHLSRTCSDQNTAGELATMADECLSVAREWERSGAPPTAPDDAPKSSG